MLLDKLIKYGKRSSSYTLLNKANLKLEKVEFKLIKLPYWMVKVGIGNALEKGNLYEAVEAIVGKVERPEIEVMEFGLFVFDEYKNILELEAKNLASMPNLKMKEAGIEVLNMFGELNVIDTLADGKLSNYEAIKMMPYEDVFNKLLMDMKSNEVQIRYQELIKV